MRNFLLTNRPDETGSMFHEKHLMVRIIALIKKLMFHEKQFDLCAARSFLE